MGLSSSLRWFSDSLFVVALLAAAFLAGRPALAADTRVVFDIPDKLECRDVTPDTCAKAHPRLKVIEAKFRISASFVEGTESSIVDFVYMITSPEMRMKIQDYLPNTTLESTLAEDTIEVADTTENSDAKSEDAKVAYRVLDIGGSRNQTSKKTQSDKYKQIVSKALVLAAGTTHREHGVFFKLRPSKGASLEGGKEFTFLAVVPKEWRGDWCTVVCAARANKKSFLSNTIALAGVEQAHVGMYLSGDREASDLAESLCQIQEAHGGAVSKQMAKEASQLIETMHAAQIPHHGLEHYDEWVHSLFTLGHNSSEGERSLKDARASIADVQSRLGHLSGVEPDAITAKRPTPPAE
ncbi:MAG TPA: hypothetical protein VHY91_16400 [Pirellulales bacterium]|jgi:hypothetical protein|nr:hypothetical protein [Pirellulales bacterium]